jgi:hypothetical protein
MEMKCWVDRPSSTWLGKKRMDVVGEVVHYFIS